MFLGAAMGFRRGGETERLYVLANINTQKHLFSFFEWGMAPA